MFVVLNHLVRILILPSTTVGIHQERIELLRSFYPIKYSSRAIPWVVRKVLNVLRAWQCIKLEKEENTPFFMNQDKLELIKSVTSSFVLCMLCRLRALHRKRSFMRQQMQQTCCSRQLESNVCSFMRQTALQSNVHIFIWKVA